MKKEQVNVPKPVGQALSDNAPWKPPRAEIADMESIRAVMNGEADATQQRRAMKWIIESCCGTYEMPYRPGEDGRRDTDFALGRQFVGQQIVAMPHKLLIIKQARKSE